MGMRVRPLTVGFVAAAACVLFVQGLTVAQSVSTLHESSAVDVGQWVALPAVRGLLASAGLWVMMLAQGFVAWVTWVKPSAALGGLHFRREADRRIDAAAAGETHTSYGSDELVDLRWLAQDRVARSRSRAVSWATGIAAVGFIAMCVGIVVAPPEFGSGVMAQASTQVIRFVGVLGVLVGVLAVALSRRRAVDQRAEAFLARTATISTDRPAL